MKPSENPGGKNEAAAPSGVDQALSWGLALATATVFWPVTRWLGAETAERQQIRQAALLLAAAAAVVVWRGQERLRVVADLGNRSLWLLGAAFAAAACAGVLKQNWIVLPAFALALAGVLRVLFGAEGQRLFRPLVAGVAALCLIVLVFPVLDWPLRQLAGLGAGLALAKCGLAPGLAVTGTAADPQLVLSVAGGHFLVATECNGFGLITSGALVAILAGGITGRRWWAIAALVPAGMLIGFVFNLLRILAISTTARYFPGHYDLLHETAGTLALWAGLGLIGWIAWKPEREASTPART